MISQPQGYYPFALNNLLLWCVWWGESCPLHWGMFDSFLGLHPLGSSRASQHTVSVEEGGSR